MCKDILAGGAAIQANAEKAARDQMDRKAKSQRDILKYKSDVMRIVTNDDVIKHIRLYAQSLHDTCMNALLDPKTVDISQINQLKGALHAHKAYLDMFTIWEKEGRDALRKLLDQERNENEG